MKREMRSHYVDYPDYHTVNSVELEGDEENYTQTCITWKFYYDGKYWRVRREQLISICSTHTHEL